jgi:antitoxin HicB
MTKLTSYPVALILDDNGTFLVTSSDFPELTSFGDTAAESLKHSRGALLEAIEARMHDRQAIPPPSRGKHMVRLPAQAAAKVLRYRRARDLAQS